MSKCSVPAKGADALQGLAWGKPSMSISLTEPLSGTYANCSFHGVQSHHKQGVVSMSKVQIRLSTMFCIRLADGLLHGCSA